MMRQDEKAGRLVAGRDINSGSPGRSVQAYLDDARMVGENQTPPHAILRPYRDVAQALAAGPDSPWRVSLDGVWRLRHSMTVDGLAERFFDDAPGAPGWNEVRVPHVWQQDGYDTPVYRNVTCDIVPYDPPRVPTDLNPSGGYLREFELPEQWSGRRCFLRFEGVMWGCFVWVNGRYAGYDSGGYVPAEFDVTDLVRPGSNTIAVRVHRWSAAAYLANMDMWHFSGIFREVWLYATPQVWMRDATVTTTLDETYDNAELTVAVELAAGENVPAGVAGHRVRATLFDASGQRIDEVLSAPASADDPTVRLSAPVTAAHAWSDEHPYLYRLVLELLDPSGAAIQVTGQDVGLRTIEIKDGRLCVNGVAVDLRGVNRHEHDPRTGRAVPYARLVEDVVMLKRHNVNAVRTSHYPNDPRWYELCDRHGIYLCDEVDVETHYRSAPGDCLADEPRWQHAMLDRFAAMVERDKNHPCVIMWSTGNEAGLGAAHFAMADYARRRDPSRPLYHQADRSRFNGDAPYADVWGPRYPSPEALTEIARTTNRPVVLGEWSHVLGNGLGNYEDMWRVIRREPSLQGGFVWEWLSQELTRPLVTTPDRSGNQITAFLSGNPTIVPGRAGGRAVCLSGLDDWVEVAGDPALDLTGDALTVDAWVKPADWAGDFTIVSKGPQYTLRMRDAETVEFAVDTGVVRIAAATVPQDWYAAWHRVTGAYDGRHLRVFIDGSLRAEVPVTGALVSAPFPVTIGRNPALHTHNHSGRTAHGSIDAVRVYAAALTPAQIAAEPYDDAVLALDFDDYIHRGEYDSYGTSPFIVDGLVAADRTPRPAAQQLKYSHAWIRFTAGATPGEVTVTNDYRFSDTSAIEVRWQLVEGEQILAAGTARPVLAPGESANLDLDLPPGDGKRWLNLQAVLISATPWADAGHVVAFEQLPAGGATAMPGSIRAPRGRTGAGLALKRFDTILRVSGAGFEYSFDTYAGRLSAMRVGARELLRAGPRLLVWRATLGNEIAKWGGNERTPAERFRAVGLDRLQSRVLGCDAETTATGVRVAVCAFDAAPGAADGLAHTLTYHIDATGVIELEHEVEPVGAGIRALPWLPRVGMALALPARYHRFCWYGRGPFESYPDRKDAAAMGVWRGTVDAQHVCYLPPQDNGNKTDTRWARLTDTDGVGLKLSGDEFNVAVTRFDDADLDRAAYPFLLAPTDHITVNVCHAVTGVGDTPNLVQPQYRVRPDQTYRYRITLEPLSGEATT